MNFLGMGPGEVLLILVIALVIFGPGRLPEIGAQVGRGIREFRRMSSDITSDLTREMNMDDGDVRQTYSEIRDTLSSVRRFSLTDVIMNQATGPTNTQQPAVQQAASAQPAVETQQAEQVAQPKALPTDDIEEDILLGEMEPEKQV